MNSRIVDDLSAQEVISLLEKKVFEVSSTDALFNQYKDINLDFDKPDAAQIRRENLRRYVQNCLEAKKRNQFT
jgi:hypothetical protein